MKRNVYSIALLFLIGLIVGFKTIPAEKANAKEMPKLVYVPEMFDSKKGLSFNVDLNNMTVSGEKTKKDKIEVNITKKDSIITKYKTIIKKEKEYVMVKSLPPMRPSKSTIEKPNYILPDKI